MSSNFNQLFTIYHYIILDQKELKVNNKSPPFFVKAMNSKKQGLYTHILNAVLSYRTQEAKFKSSSQLCEVVNYESIMNSLENRFCLQTFFFFLLHWWLHMWLQSLSSSRQPALHILPSFRNVLQRKNRPSCFSAECKYRLCGLKVISFCLCLGAAQPSLQSRGFL